MAKTLLNEDREPKDAQVSQSPEEACPQLLELNDPETPKNETKAPQKDQRVLEKEMSKRHMIASQKNSYIAISRDGKVGPLSSQETIQSRKSVGEFCRICHDIPSLETFISPCNCKGSLSQVHKSCLERWLAESDTSECEVCGFTYRVQRFPKYSLLMSVIAWLTSQGTWRDRRNLLVDVIAILILSPVICLSTMMALQLMDSLFGVESDQEKQQRNESNPIAEITPKWSLELLGTMMARIGQMGVISMILTMDMAFISWLAMRLQHHVATWYNWYRRNCKVTLIGYPEIPSSHQQPSTSSAISIPPITV